jgi:hypothetical protein
MLKIISLLIALSFCSNCYASVDIEIACKEKKEQKKSLLTKMSTSLQEANLAGQCTGYNSYDEIDIKQACSEFLEQKNSLFSNLSTSNLEANLAGMCIGAIYRVSEECSVSNESINYSLIAEEVISVKSVIIQLDCNGSYYGR